MEEIQNNLKTGDARSRTRKFRKGFEDQTSIAQSQQIGRFAEQVYQTLANFKIAYNEYVAGDPVNYRRYAEQKGIIGANAIYLKSFRASTDYYGQIVRFYKEVRTTLDETSTKALDSKLLSLVADGDKSLVSKDDLAAMQMECIQAPKEDINEALRNSDGRFYFPT